MKGLLHSKRFKEKLYRWLFMYVGVLGLLTTVITYSKYITKLTPKEDSARSAVFKADIVYVADESGTPCPAAGCPNNMYRPTSEIKYYFKLNTDFEVLTDLFLTLRIAQIDGNYNNYEIVSIRNVNDTEPIKVNAKTTTITIQNAIQNDKITSMDGIYEVVVKYDGELKKGTAFNSLDTVLIVDYSAEQRSS